MLCEFALDPSLLATYDNARYLLGHFGPHKGRLIARFPKHWKRLVFEGLAGLKAIEKTRIQILLGRLSRKHFARRRGCSSSSDADWLSQALTENDRLAFHAIVTDANDASRNQLDGNTLDESVELWHVETDRIVRRQAEEMAAAIQLLLQVSQHIVFIEPHFRAGKTRMTAPLLAFISKALASTDMRHPKQKKPKFELHTLDKTIAFSFLESECRRHLPPLLPPHVQLTIRQWGQRQNGDEMHDRYVLTDVGGVEFGAGLDERKDEAKTTRVSLLGELVRDELWSRFLGKEPGYDSSGAAFVVVGRA